MGYSDPDKEEVDCNIYLCKDMFIFEYDLYGKIYRTLFRCGSLYGEGQLYVWGSTYKTYDYYDNGGALSFTSLTFKNIEFIVYKDFLLFQTGRSYYTLIDVEKGESADQSFSDFYSDTTFPFFSSKNVFFFI